jgi:hypothetical protein
VAVAASITSSSAMIAGHQADARRLTASIVPAPHPPRD